MRNDLCEFWACKFQTKILKKVYFEKRKHKVMSTRTENLPEFTPPKLVYI